MYLVSPPGIDPKNVVADGVSCGLESRAPKRETGGGQRPLWQDNGSVCISHPTAVVLV